MALIKKYKKGGFWSEDKIVVGKLALKYITTAFNNAEIPYFINCGTLLGCVREKRFIPIDIDIDFAICAENFNPRLLTELKKQPVSHIGIRKFPAINRSNIWHGLNDKDELPYKVGVRVSDPKTGGRVGCDIGIFYLGKDDLDGHRCHYRTSKTFPTQFMEKLTTTKFYGMEVSLPQHAEEYLELLYGENWRIPLEVQSPEKYYEWVERR